MNPVSRVSGHSRGPVGGRSPYCTVDASASVACPDERERVRRSFVVRFFRSFVLAFEMWAATKDYQKFA